MKCREIEIKNNETDEWDIVPVSAVFNLAVSDCRTNPAYRDNGFWGINIGVAVPLDVTHEDERFNEKYLSWGEFNGPTVHHVMFYLLGENGEKVPVRGKDGNAYNENFGGSCLFGWIAPDIIAEDEHPMPKEKI